MRPKVRVRLNGMTRMRKISMRFVRPLGFSNGCAELALKKPPPFVPSSLIASWLATGPPGIVCAPPVRVETAVSPAKFCTTPLTRSTMANSAARGSRTRIVMRVRSTQKLPSRSVCVRTSPRTRATATAMPTAADRKFCTARPAIWAV
jgi:hypothetical protein